LADSQSDLPGEDSHKSPPFDIVEWDGRVAALGARDVARATVQPITGEKVLPESVIYTYECTAYDG
jgi:hypothetical protein